MDRSLDDIIAERPQSTNRNRRPPQSRRNNFPRDGVRKSTREDRADLDRDWVHDRYDDDREDSRPARGGRNRRDEYNDKDRYPAEGEVSARLRIDNLHWDLTEEDLTDLFERIGPTSKVSLRYDRAGRSDGTAFVTYVHTADAKTAIREFDGANAKGQPIKLTLLPSAPAGGRGGRGQNPFFSDRVEKPPRSLFDRVERPRSASPGKEDYDARTRRGAPRERRSDVSKPPPDGIDRYVPGQNNRSPVRRPRGDGGRRPGQRREEARKPDTQGRRLVGGRPRMTQEELDAEMADYWKGTENPNAAADTAVTETAPAAQVAAAVAPGDDDIDMIE